MKIGVFPYESSRRHEYSSGCRAFALTRNLDYCEICQTNKKYDIVLFQKHFNVRKMRPFQEGGALCVVDSCDSHLLSMPDGYREALRFADFITASTSSLISKMVRDLSNDSIVNKAFVGPDIMEFDYNREISEKRKNLTVVIYGTYHNVCVAIKFLDCLSENFDEIVFITDNNSSYISSLNRQISKNDNIKIIGWRQKEVHGIISSCHVSVVLYRAPVEGDYKTCNRTLISLFCGTPVVSGFNLQVEELMADKPDDIFVYDSDSDFDNKIKSAIDRSTSMNFKDRYSLRDYGEECKYGAKSSVKEWDKIFVKMIESKKV